MHSIKMMVDLIIYDTWDGGKYEGITQIFTSRTTRDHTYPPLTHHHLFSTLPSLNIRTPTSVSGSISL